MHTVATTLESSIKPSLDILNDILALFPKCAFSFPLAVLHIIIREYYYDYYFDHERSRKNTSLHAFHPSTIWILVGCGLRSSLRLRFAFYPSPKPGASPCPQLPRDQGLGLGEAT